MPLFLLPGPPQGETKKKGGFSPLANKKKFIYRRSVAVGSVPAAIKTPFFVFLFRQRRNKKGRDKVRRRRNFINYFSIFRAKTVVFRLSNAISKKVINTHQNAPNPFAVSGFLFFFGFSQPAIYVLFRGVREVHFSAGCFGRLYWFWCCYGGAVFLSLGGLRLRCVLSSVGGVVCCGCVGFLVVTRFGGEI
jgi:hypothetical protein